MQKYELPCYTLFTKKCWDVKCYHSSIRFQQNYVPRYMPKNSDHCCCMFQMICSGENAKSPYPHPNQVMPPAPAVCRCSNHPISFRQSIPPFFIILCPYLCPIRVYQMFPLYNLRTQPFLLQANKWVLWCRRCCGSIHPHPIDCCVKYFMRQNYSVLFRR